MRRAERVVHIEVAQLAQLPGEFRIISFLFRVEAQVFQHERLPAFQLVRHLLGLRANTVRRKANVLAAPQDAIEQDAQPLGYRLQAHLGIGLALGPPEVRRQYQARAVPQRVLDAGQRLANARVVHDAAVVERDVEVNAHENAFVVQRKIANG